MHFRQVACAPLARHRCGHRLEVLEHPGLALRPQRRPFAQDPLDLGTNLTGTCQQSFQFAVLGIDAPAHRLTFGAIARVEGPELLRFRLGELKLAADPGQFIAGRSTRRLPVAGRGQEADNEDRDARHGGGQKTAGPTQ